MTLRLSRAQLARLEKNLRAAASLGSALAILGREILKDVKSAELAITAYRQQELPLQKAETPAESRSKRYEANTKKLSDVFERPAVKDATQQRPKRSKRAS